MIARQFAVAVLLAWAGPAHAQTGEAPISSAINTEEGEYLVDGSGMALYTFKADTPGRGASTATSACMDDCLGEWPPLVTDAAPVGDAQVDASMLGTLIRPDDMVQITYNGWPLYYYFEDVQPGVIRGDDIDGFGEDCILLARTVRDPARLETMTSRHYLHRPPTSSVAARPTCLAYWGGGGTKSGRLLWQPS